MEVKILEFIPDKKGFREGYVDFYVDHGNGKSETFRGISFLEKDSSRWLNGPVVQRDRIWLKRYERTPSLEPLYTKALEALLEFLNNDSNF